ncbi:exonuclease [Philodulcilactobacillus myokoensis]|uniref:DNA polymerase III polC-type n=1 Tax=Philodulcilactobacillus myokoensis TaxID=2929573 RepID=A0A9W6B1B2_9LACO|nr:3'-5' exonuclease [Philodulcilactobacillus myokoensis]GLB47117.1 exonuclease [Philodulcilactobacillus myokoensis]
MNFIAIDFETAARKRASACSLAITVIRKDEIASEFYTLINPEVKFYWRNVKVNGIHEKDVQNAPTFPEIWPMIKSLFQNNMLVIAHNNSFDNSVLRKTLERYQINEPKYLTLDTVKTSRHLFPNLINYKLDTVCRDLNIPLHHHHNALDDSLACANILIEQKRQFGEEAIKPFVRIFN